MKYERMTQWVGDGASLILDNPRNVEEAKEQLQDKFKLACIKLATLEDKIERGELVDEARKNRIFLSKDGGEVKQLYNGEEVEKIFKEREALKHRAKVFELALALAAENHSCEGCPSKECDGSIRGTQKCRDTIVLLCIVQAEQEVAEEQE